MDLLDCAPIVLDVLKHIQRKEKWQRLVRERIDIRKNFEACFDQTFSLREVRFDTKHPATLLAQTFREGAGARAEIDQILGFG